MIESPGTCHLQPFTFQVTSELAKRDLRTHVTFSTHCFSESWDVVNNHHHQQPGLRD
jgi:hypothetical protein